MRLACLALFLGLATGLGSSGARAQEPAAPSERLALPPLCAPGEDGCFEDTLGRWRDADYAYAHQLALRNPHYLRGFGEQIVALGIGATWYWLDKETNLVDWDRPGWRARFNGEAVRFDNNTFEVNFVWHAMSGSAFYGLARANDLNVGWSLFYSFTTSMLWEYVLEFREKISINDVIFTPGAGLAIGEFWHRLGRYLNSAPGGGSRANRAFGWTFGVHQALHYAADAHEPPPPGTATDDLGYDADMWHAMRSWYGFSLAEPSEPGETSFLVHELGYEGSFVAIPGFLRPGTFQRFFKDADITGLRLRFGLSSTGSGVDILADTTLLGFYRQDIERTPRGRSGGAVMIGTNVEYFYRNEDYDGWVDRQGIFGFPGLAFDGYLVRGRATYHLRYRMNGEFAGMHGRAFPQWDEAYPDERTKTVLEREGYYFGWGWSSTVAADLTLPYLELGGSFRYGRYRSQEGYDRDQELLSVDVPARDAMVDYDAWIRVFPFERLGVGAYLELAARGQVRASKIGEFRADVRLDRYQVSVGAVY